MKNEPLPKEIHTTSQTTDAWAFRERLKCKNNVLPQALNLCLWSLAGREGDCFFFECWVGEHLCIGSLTFLAHLILRCLILALRIFITNLSVHRLAFSLCVNQVHETRTSPVNLQAYSAPLKVQSGFNPVIGAWLSPGDHINPLRRSCIIYTLISQVSQVQPSPVGAPVFTGGLII